MTKFKLALFSGVATIAFATPTFAQDQDSAGTSADAGNDDTIVVTATRREESLQDVAASVVSVDPEVFTLSGKTSVEDLIRYTPGLYFQDTEGVAGRGTITARGIPQLGATPVFATYIDDAPLTSNTPYNQGSFISIDSLLLDIERVEIVKGPQGTLFGATSVGGMLRYVTKKPALEEFRATAGVDIHSVKGGEIGQTYNGRVSIPLVPGKLGLSLGAYYQDTAGYPERVNPATGAIIDEDIGGSEIQGYAADLLYQATDNLDFRFKYLRQESSSEDIFTVNLAGLGSTDGLFSDYSTVSTGDFLDLTTELFSGSINYGFGWATLTSTTSHSSVEQDVFSDLTAAFAPTVDFLFGLAPGTTTSNHS